jgi:multidrug efflux pump subunit AcrA (membrane-fusion protein)
MKGRTVEGKVTRTAWALDPKTRTIRVEIDFSNPGGRLRPGLYAKTLFQNPSRNPCYLPV